MTENVTENNNIAEIKRLRRLLREIADIAQHASLTGSLAGGASRAVRRYNSVVARLEEIGSATPGMFEPLPDNTTFDELGVESTLLAGYLKEDIEEHERQHAGGHAGHGGGPNVIIGSLNGLEGLKDIQELKDLGRMIREGFPEWMKDKAAASAAPESAAADAPDAPAAPDVAAPEPAPEPMPEFITGR